MLPSANKTGLLLLGGRALRYAQKQDKIGFFINIKTVSSPSVLWEETQRPFGFSGIIPRPVIAPHAPEMARLRPDSGS